MTPESPLVGKRLEELSLRAAGINIVAIVRSLRLGTEMIRPVAQTELQVDDILLVDVVPRRSRWRRSARKFALDALPLDDDSGYFTDSRHEIGMVEAIVHNESTLIDRTVLAARVRGEHGLTVIGLRRGRVVHGHGLLHEKLRIGDTLLLVGFWTDIRRLHAEGGNMVVLNMPANWTMSLPAASRAPHALAVLLLVVGLMVERHCAERAGRPDRLPPHGPVSLRRSEQRLSVDQLEEPHTDRRDDAVLSRAATDRRGRSGGRRDGGLGRRRRAARRDGDAVRHNGVAGHVHLEYGDGRADGARRARHRRRSSAPRPIHSR